MNEKEKVICYYHNDMDGIASASIVKKVYPNAVFLSCDYGYVWEKSVVKDALVIVVDFTFPNMKELNDSCKLLCWIDHHKTAMERNLELWNSDDIDGLRNLDKAGCELTWEWFYPHEEQPRAVDFIGDMDMWKFEYGDETKSFVEYASLQFKKPNTGLFALELIDGAVLKGGILLIKKREQVRKAFGEGINVIFEGHKTRLINTNVNVSNTGEYCYKDMNYPIALIWSVRGDKVICGLRSNTIDVSEIAKKYDGGGHKSAAGFSTNLDFIKKLIGVKK